MTDEGGGGSVEGDEDSIEDDDNDASSSSDDESIQIIDLSLFAAAGLVVVVVVVGRLHLLLCFLLYVAVVVVVCQMESKSTISGSESARETGEERLMSWNMLLVSVFRGDGNRACVSSWAAVPFSLLSVAVDRSEPELEYR